jgi:hypothetical protein
MGAELPGLDNCPLTIISCSTSCDSGQVPGDDPAAGPVAAGVAGTDPISGVALTGVANDRVTAVIAVGAMAVRISLISDTD